MDARTLFFSSEDLVGLKESQMSNSIDVVVDERSGRATGADNDEEVNWASVIFSVSVLIKPLRFPRLTACSGFTQ